MSQSFAAPSGSADGAIFAELEQVGVRCSVLAIGCCVDEGVDDTGGPREDGGYDVQPGVRDAVVRHVHDHERQEAGQETKEDRQHERRQTRVFFFLFCCLAGEFTVEEEEKIEIIVYIILIKLNVPKQKKYKYSHVAIYFRVSFQAGESQIQTSDCH